MNDEEIKAGVLRLFDEFRQSRGAPFDEDRFMAFLTTTPESTGRRHADTFGGCRRFWRFMNAVQLEFGICFNNEEWDRGYALSALVDLIREKKRDPSQGSRLARKRLREALQEKSDRTVIWSLAAIIPFALPIMFVGTMVRISLVAAWAASIVGIYYYHSRRVAYARKLVESVGGATG